MLGNPKAVTMSGAGSWVVLGLGAALVALLIGSFVPAIIPARAKTVRI